MFARSWFPALVAGCVLAVCTGCAGSHRAGGQNLGAKGIAPDDVAHHSNPNAPYILADGAPRLVPRASVSEAANAQLCDPEVLSVEEISGDNNGIFRSVKLAFMNRGAVPCRLGGYPAVSLINASGEVIGTIRTEKITAAQVLAELAKSASAPLAEPAPAVTLMPHAVAAFQVLWTTGAECSSVARIVVRAPSTERAFTIPQPMRICTGRIQVTELRLDEGDV